jgi:hypothetical membrane protein
MNRGTSMAGDAALLMFIAAAAVFGAMFDAGDGGFSQRTHPLAWLGAQGMARATLFNLCGFVLPGMLAAVALWSLRPALPADARWSARIGAQLVLLSALAFAAQGVLPLDLQDMDGAASGLHAAAWTVWCLSFAAGALALAWGLRRNPPHRGIPMICVVAGSIVPLFAFVAPLWIPNAFAQRAAFVLWLGWVAWAGRIPPLSRA